MKKFSKILIPMLILATVLISACTGSAVPSQSTGGGKVEAAPVEFTGVIEAMDGNQWTVSGQVITVEPSVLHDGPFNVGDTVKVEAEVQADGSIVVTRVETPDVEDNSNDVNSNDVNSNDADSDDANSNDVNSNDDSNDGNVNDDNGNDDNSNDGNVNDDSSDDNGNDDSSDDDNGNDDDSEDDEDKDDSSDDNGNGDNSNGG